MFNQEEVVVLYQGDDLELIIFESRKSKFITLSSFERDFESGVYQAFKGKWDNRSSELIEVIDDKKLSLSDVRKFL